MKKFFSVAAATMFVLSIAMSTDRNDIEISVDSKLGEGSTFTLKIPRFSSAHEAEFFSRHSQTRLLT